MTHEAGTPDVLVLPRLDVVEEVAAAVTGREHWIAVSLDPTITLDRLGLHHLPAATVYVDSPAGLVLRLTGAAVSKAAAAAEVAGMFTEENLPWLVTVPKALTPLGAIRAAFGRHSIPADNTRDVLLFLNHDPAAPQHWPILWVDVIQRVDPLTAATLIAAAAASGAT